jgi:hypothetical protein
VASLAGMLVMACGDRGGSGDSSPSASPAAQGETKHATILMCGDSTNLGFDPQD